jgi:hypothetical protein
MSMNFIRERLEDQCSKKSEALSWLEGGEGRNTLGEHPTSDESVELVSAVYEAGAEEVLAIEIDEYDEQDGIHGNTGKLILRLPSEPSARQRVFEWCARQAEMQGYDGPKDEGQTHVFVSLD